MLSQSPSSSSRAVPASHNPGPAVLHAPAGAAATWQHRQLTAELLHPEQGVVWQPSFSGMLGEDQQQSVERAFSITTHQLDLARQQGHQLQVRCVACAPLAQTMGVTGQSLVKGPADAGLAVEPCRPIGGVHGSAVRLSQHGM